MKKFSFYVSETRHFRIEVEADDRQSAWDHGLDVWINAPDVGGYEVPETDTQYQLHEHGSLVG